MTRDHDTWEREINAPGNAAEKELAKLAREIRDRVNKMINLDDVYPSDAVGARAAMIMLVADQLENVQRMAEEGLKMTMPQVPEVSEDSEGA